MVTLLPPELLAALYDKPTIKDGRSSTTRMIKPRAEQDGLAAGRFVWKPTAYSAESVNTGTTKVLETSDAGQESATALKRTG